MRAEREKQHSKRDDSRSEEQPATRWERTRANAKTILSAILLAIFIRIVLFEAFEIEGPSMEPTLLNGDRVVVAKFFYGLFLPWTSEAMVTWGRPDPGDVVIVRSPADDNIDIVKRVIGVAGDTIAIKDNVVYRNGTPVPTDVLGPCRHEQLQPVRQCIVVAEELDDEGYRISRTPAPADEPPVHVPPGHIFILGDHRDRSNDSRNLGPIPVERVKGRALFIYWSSYDHIRWDRIGEGVD